MAGTPSTGPITPFGGSPPPRVFRPTRSSASPRRFKRSSRNTIRSTWQSSSMCRVPPSGTRSIPSTRRTVLPCPRTSRFKSPGSRSSWKLTGSPTWSSGDSRETTSWQRSPPWRGKRGSRRSWSPGTRTSASLPARISRSWIRARTFSWGPRRSPPSMGSLPACCPTCLH